MSFDVVEKWQMTEKTFSVNKYQGVPGQKSWIMYKKFGNLPVMFSAPHSNKHIREGKVKVEDYGTGGIAVVSAMMSGGSAMAMAGNQLGDANWDTEHPYKDRISEWHMRGGRMLLDIHGMTTASAEELGADIVLGLSEHQNVCNRFIATRIVEEAAKLGIIAKISDTKFNAKPNTVTDFCMKSGIYAVQAELSPKLRKQPSEKHFGANKAIGILSIVAQSSARMLGVLDELRPEHTVV